MQASSTYMSDDMARVRVFAMLEQVDSLPLPEGWAPLHDRNRERNSGERGFDMCRHVIRPFHGVGNPAHRRRIRRGHQSPKKFFEIAPHVRVCILLHA